MNKFVYHRPDTLAQTRALLDAEEDAKILAGGMTLFPTMKLRLAAPSDLVDLAALDELRGIQVDAQSVTIGAMTTHAEVARHKEVQDALPALSEVAHLIGDAQVRNRGTLGGSIANSDPAADYPAAVMGLDAVINTQTRQIPARDYFTGLFETALDERELIVSVTFRRPRFAAYAKFPNPASRYAVVGVFVAQTPDGSSRVAITGAAARVFRESAFEQALDAHFSASSLDGLVVDCADFNEDVFATAEYRAQLVSVMAKRAVSRLEQEHLR